LPKIYKASFVTLEDNVVPIDTGETSETSTADSDNVNPSAGSERPVSREGKLKDARDEAEQIVQKARGEALLITDNAKWELNKLRVKTEEDARSQGHAEGFNKGMKEAEAAIRDAEKELQEAQGKRDEILKSTEPQIVELITKVLEKLVGDIHKTSPESILHLVREGLSESTGSDDIKLKLSPDDYDYVQEHFEEISKHAGSRKIELVKDAALKPMDCVIETAYGNVDSSLEQQFESLKADLLQL